MKCSASPALAVIQHSHLHGVPSEVLLKFQSKEEDSFENVIGLTQSESSVTIDLSRRDLTIVPSLLLQRCRLLKFLYLEGNNIVEVQPELFRVLRFLVWLDLRNNSVECLPKTMAHHANLEVILLQKNNLRELPLELGLVPKLRGLQLMGNPLEFPPRAVVQKGTECILSFLLHEWKLRNPAPVASNEKDRAIGHEKAPPVINASKSLTHIFPGVWCHSSESPIPGKNLGDPSSTVNMTDECILKRKSCIELGTLIGKGGKPVVAQDPTQQWLQNNFVSPVPQRRSSRKSMESQVHRKMMGDMEKRNRREMLEKQNIILQRRRFS